MVLRSERWLELRRFRALHEAGLSISQIARETGMGAGRCVSIWRRTHRRRRRNDGRGQVDGRRC